MTTKLTFNRFKKIIETINRFEKESRILDKIFLKNSIGFIDFGDDILSELVKMIEMNFGDEYDNVSWWLWESKKGGKFVWQGNKKYDLNKLEDFYNWLNKKYDKVPSEEE